MSFPYPPTVSALYCPPRYNLKKSHFETFFHTPGNKFIAGGDYISKHIIWGSRLTTAKGRELYEPTIDNNYSCISTGTPIYWQSKKSGSTGRLQNKRHFPFLRKHHRKFILIIRPHTNYSNNKYNCISKKSKTILHTTKTNWELFRQIIESNNAKYQIERTI
jgi:hypothetical protein